MKEAIRVLIGCALILLGVLAAAFYGEFSSYQSGNLTLQDGKRIFQKLSEFKARSGDWPDQDWFAENCSEQSPENRFWRYYHPPKGASEYGGVVLSTPIRRKGLYMVVFDGGAVLARSAEDIDQILRTKTSEQVEQAVPPKSDRAGG